MLHCCIYTYNTCLNFYIHCSYRFRRGFKQFFRWCPFIHLPHEPLTRREVLTSRYSCGGSPDHRIVRNGKFHLDNFWIFKVQMVFPDTERSFLYTCSGSPKAAARKAQGKWKFLYFCFCCCFNNDCEKKSVTTYKR